MGLFDALTGAPSRRATRDGQTAVWNGLKVGTEQIGQGLNAATGYLLGPGGSAASAITSGRDAGADALRTGYGSARGTLAQLSDLYQPVVSGGRSAYDALLDATGANGAEGSSRARSNFENSLGYRAGLDSGLDAVTRSAAARGMAASGNTSRDLYNYASDYQARRSNDYVNNLSGLLGLYQTGLSGQAAGITGQAELDRGLGSNLAELYNNSGRSLGGTYSNLAGLNFQGGTNLANLQSGAASNFANLGMQGAQAQERASGTALGGLLGLGSAGLNVLGSGSLTGGGGLGGILNLFRGNTVNRGGYGFGSGFDSADTSQETWI